MMLENGLMKPGMYIKRAWPDHRHNGNPYIEVYYLLSFQEKLHRWRMFWVYPENEQPRRIIHEMFLPHTSPVPVQTFPTFVGFKE